MRKNILATLLILVLVFAVSCDAETILGIGKKMSGLSQPVAGVNLPVIEETKEDIIAACGASYDAEFVGTINSLVENITRASANSESDREIKEALGKRATTVPEAMGQMEETVMGLADSLPSKVNTFFEGNVPTEVADAVEEIVDVVAGVFSEEKTVSDVVSFQIVTASIIEVGSKYELDAETSLTNLDSLLGAVAADVNEDLNGFIEDPVISTVMDQLTTMLYINDSSIKLSTLISLFV